MEALVAQLEPEGIIGPSMMAGWLANAARVRQQYCCWMKHSRCSRHECSAICTNKSLLLPPSLCVHQHQQQVCKDFLGPARHGMMKLSQAVESMELFKLYVRQAANQPDDDT
jgi:hypothetical protein